MRALVRDPGAADLPGDVRLHKGDAVTGDGLAEALEGVRTAYYLIHSMGRGATRATTSPSATARRRSTSARRQAPPGVERVVYLGGLGPTGPDASIHLRSRHEVAELLGQRVNELVYVRAAMVIGPGSASFEMLRHLVKRLPLMLTPRWVDTRSQPVAIDDVVRDARRRRRAPRRRPARFRSEAPRC